MKWYSPSYWLSTLTGRSMKQAESPPSGPSYLAGNMPDGSSKPGMKRGRPRGSTNKTKSKPTVSRSSSQKKQNSGIRSKKK
jgi:hypothetical protein